jgi:hypothetical protein
MPLSAELADWVEGHSAAQQARDEGTSRWPKRWRPRASRSIRVTSRSYTNNTAKPLMIKKPISSRLKGIGDNLGKAPAPHISTEVRQVSLSPSCRLLKWQPVW